MRIAVISDIHSNLPALTKTLDVIESFSVDAIHCLGDIVGYGAHPNECVDLIRERCSTVLCGNHDLGAIGKESLDHFNQYGRSAIRWTREGPHPRQRRISRDPPLHRDPAKGSRSHTHPSLIRRNSVTWSPGPRRISASTLSRPRSASSDTPTYRSSWPTTVRSTRTVPNGGIS